MALSLEPEASSLLYLKVMGFSLRGLLPLVPAKFLSIEPAMLDGLTAPAHRYCWTWSIDDSACHTSPGKFILTVPDLHLVLPVSRWIFTCRNRLYGRSAFVFRLLR